MEFSVSFTPLPLCLRGRRFGEYKSVRSEVATPIYRGEKLQRSPRGSKKAKKTKTMVFYGEPSDPDKSSN
jgi:hypothetical protein